MAAIGLLLLIYRNVNNRLINQHAAKSWNLFVCFFFLNWCIIVQSGNLVIYPREFTLIRCTNAKGLQIMIMMMIAQCPWRSGKMLLSFTGYQCQNYLEGLIAKSLVDVSCTAKEPTGFAAVYGQGNTSLLLKVWFFPSFLPLGRWIGGWATWYQCCYSVLLPYHCISRSYDQWTPYTLFINYMWEWILPCTTTGEFLQDVSFVMSVTKSPLSIRSVYSSRKIKIFPQPYWTQTKSFPILFPTLAGSAVVFRAFPVRFVGVTIMRVQNRTKEFTIIMLKCVYSWCTYKSIFFFFFFKLLSLVSSGGTQGGVPPRIQKFFKKEVLNRSISCYLYDHFLTFPVGHCSFSFMLFPTPFMILDQS